MKFQEFSKKLIDWYKRNYRPLPWREISDPYNIWLSEIILQQTRVEQGLPYYKKFISTYPTIFHLSNANDDDVLRLWQGLGYYSRARNLLKCAREIVSSNNGVFPDNYKDLLRLPGIGKYTAAAIASLSFKEKVAVVDGNVYRVLSRVFGDEKDISSSGAHEHFKSLAENFIPKEQPDLFNQGLMELGATICTPKKPKCEICVFNSFCFAHEHKAQAKFPVKEKKTKVRERKFFYVLFYNELGCLMKKRDGKDIWAELYDLLWIDTLDFDETIFLQQHLAPNMLNEAREIYFSSGIRHILTHQRLETSFVNIYLDKLPKTLSFREQEMSYFSWEAVAKLPKPVLVNNYLTSNSFIDQ